MLVASIVIIGFVAYGLGLATGYAIWSTRQKNAEAAQKIIEDTEFRTRMGMLKKPKYPSEYEPPTRY